MLPHQIADMVVTDYGVTCDSEGMRVHARQVRPARDRKITSEKQYYRACLSVALAAGKQLNPDWQGYDCLVGADGKIIDHRLVKAGWNHFSPSVRVGAKLDEFAAYWSIVAERPHRVGSSYNPEVSGVMTAFLARIPARTMRGVPSWVRIQPRRASRGKIRQLERISRCMQRASARIMHDWSPKALEALGRLCPELQRVAIESVDRRIADALRAARESPEYVTAEARLGSALDGRPLLEKMDQIKADFLKKANVYGKIRIRHIDWALVAEAQKKLAADKSGRLRAAMAGPRRSEALRRAAVGDNRSTSAWICPEYPLVPVDIARRIRLGESPLDIAKSQEWPDWIKLTARLAHEWCATGAPNPESFARRSIELDLPQECRHVRSITVANWLRHINKSGKWELMTRVRDIAGPAGQRMQIAFIQMIDELQDADLSRGLKTGIWTAFNSVAARMAGPRLEAMAKDHRVLREAPRWRLGKRIRALVTPAELVREGKEMHHCVGGYSSAVESGQSIILSIRSFSGHRSTAEVTPAGKILQHRARCNGAPHPHCELALRRTLALRLSA